MSVRRWAAVLSLLFVLGACSSDPSDPASAGSDDESDGSSSEASQAEEPAAPAEGQADGEIGPAETTELTIGFRFPNATFYLPQLIATEMGYFEEEGLEIREIVTAADLGAALQGGDVDIAMEWPEAPYQAAEADLPMTIIGGYLCRTRQAFATSPDVQSVEDLDGRAVTLAGVSGDLQAVARKNVLAENGWDLDSVDVEVVYPGPGSDVWRQFLLNDQIALMPYFIDDEVPLRDFGANFILDALVDAPRGVLVATPEFVDANPNTVTRYLRAMMRAHEYLLEPGIGEDPANRDDMLAMLADAGFPDPMPEGPWAFDENNMCPNLHIGDETWDRLMALYELDPVALEEVSTLDPLLAAQESLGLDNSPPVEVDWPPAG